MKIETLSPVHVGSGDKYLRMDFTIKDGKVVFLDSFRILQYLSEKGENLHEIAKKIGEGKLRLEEIVDISEFKKEELPFIGSTKRNEILQHIKAAGKTYIPGTSIKGAIRTVLLWKAVKDDDSLLEFAINSIKEEIRKGNRIDARKIDDRLEAKVFRKYDLLHGNKNDPKNDIMRVLRVSDTTPFSDRVVYEVKVLGTTLSILAECINTGDVSEVHLDFDDFLMDKFGENIGLQNLKEASREFAQEIVNVEQKYPVYSDTTKNEFKDLLKKDGIILRIGWGTGWYSSTIGTLLAGHRDFHWIRKKLGLGRKPKSKYFSRNFPATRRVTHDGKPLGWVRIYD